MFQAAKPGSASQKKRVPPRPLPEPPGGTIFTPGPGSNNIPTMFDTSSSVMPSPPAFSMGRGRDDTPATKTSKVDRRQQVGPGKYNPRTDCMWKRSPGWGFGGSQRPLLQDAKEGPGPEMPHMDSSRYDRAPRFGFGSIDRSKPTPVVPVVGAPIRQARRCRMPGPGDHNPNESVSSEITSCPNYSFGVLRDEVKQKTMPCPPLYNPGPGQYVLENGEAHTSPKVPRCKFGTSPKMPPKERITPGPGEYINVTTRTGGRTVGGASPKWGFSGRSGRPNLLDGHTI